ncbi:MAG TPA: DUF1631 family protein [Xanthomonadaceae bacterium]|nr:DUF1631 family protein [Xanthomonadaceae bacterium]
MSKTPSHLSAVGGTSQASLGQQPSRTPQAVLDRLRQAALPRLELACGEALSKTDDALFDLAQQRVSSSSSSSSSSSNSAQQSYFDIMREIRRERRQMEVLFRNEMIASFQEFLQPGATGFSGVPGNHGAALSLVAADELEEQLAVEQSSNSIHRRFKPMIEPIMHGLARMAIMISPNFDAPRSPLSPERFAMAFRCALGAFAAPVEVKLVLFKLYERELLLALETLYPEALRILIDSGYTSGHVPRIPQQAPATLPRSMPPDFNLGDQVAQRQGGGVGQAYYAGGGGGVETDDGMINSLHELLQVWRKIQRKDSGDGASTGFAPSADYLNQPELSSSEMLSVLSLFQADLPDGLKAALQSNESDRSLAQQLKRELITGAAALGISHGNARIGDAGEDAIDVVGMMFEVFLDERDIKQDMRGQIARLLVPYIKVALTDRRLFLHKTHPARRLLNAIAEACEGNHGEGPHERELLERVGQSVDRLVAEFNEDIAIFELLEQDLRTCIEQYKRRADLAERRVAEAQRGKERLEEARMRAEALLKKRLGARKVSPMVLDDLTRYWVHHYAVLFLREGEDGEGCMQAVRTLDQMIALADAAFHTGGLTALAETDSLQPGLLAMLASSGLAGEIAAESARAIAQHLMQPLAKVAAAVPTRAQPEIVLTAPEPRPAIAQPLPVVVEPPPSTPLEVDPADIARIRQLAVGTWVEFITDDERVQPGKLSWISPISARMLFVNKRGARMHVASAEELAAMMKEGKLRLRIADTAFDQAMHQVLGRLREGTAGTAVVAGAKP